MLCSHVYCLVNCGYALALEKTKDAALYTLQAYWSGLNTHHITTVLLIKYRFIIIKFYNFLPKKIFNLQTFFFFIINVLSKG